MSIIVFKYFTGEGIPKFKKKKMCVLKTGNFVPVKCQLYIKLDNFWRFVAILVKNVVSNIAPKTTTFFTRIATNPPKIVKLGHH